MPNLSDFNAETKAYFETLPRLVQESIIQSGVQIQNKQDLEKFVSGLTQSGQFGNL